MQVTVVGLAIAKPVFYPHGGSAQGKGVLRNRPHRPQGAGFLAQFPPCLSGREAGAGGQYWARVRPQSGQEVQLIRPHYVQPSGKGHQTDATDAAAIGEAVSRPAMRFVAVRSAAPQDVQELHRGRERGLKARAALAPQTRGLRSEDGIVLPRGCSSLYTSREH
jgi:transposase